MEIEVKSSSKPLSRNNPVRAISSKTLSPNEIELKKKMETPFWIPNNNSDLFVMKKILNQEREIKRNISNGKYNKSRNHILKTFGNEPSKPDNTLYNPLSLLEKIKRERTQKIKERLENHNHKDLDKKTQVISQFHTEKISDFIQKSRHLSLMKYSLRVKEERILREEETYQNEIESVKDSIFSMKKAKSNFEDEFSLKFDKYMKFLSVEKEKEKNELDNMMYIKSKIDATIRQLENKKNRQKERLEQYKEYKLFLISIKERDLSILNRKDLYDKAYNQNKKNSNSNTFLTQFSQDKRSPIKGKKSDQRIRREDEFSSPTANTEAILVIDKLIQKYPNKIFKEPRDLIEEIRNLETLNIDLLQKNNELGGVFHDNSQEFHNIIKEDNINNENLLNDNIMKERTLKEIKERNRKIKEEKEILLHYSDKTSSYYNQGSKTKLFRNQLYNKINNLYLICQNLIFYKEDNYRVEILDKIKNKQKSFIKNNNHIEMLRIIEKSFDNLLIRYQYFFSYFFKDLKKFEKEIELERKKKFTDDQKYESEIKKENLMKKLMERYNKANLLPKRKVAEKMRPKTKEKANVKLFNMRMDDVRLEDLLNYEEYPK